MVGLPGPGCKPPVVIKLKAKPKAQPKKEKLETLEKLDRDRWEMLEKLEKLDRDRWEMLQKLEQEALLEKDALLWEILEKLEKLEKGPVQER